MLAVGSSGCFRDFHDIRLAEGDQGSSQGGSDSNCDIAQILLAELAKEARPSLQANRIDKEQQAKVQNRFRDREAEGAEDEGEKKHASSAQRNASPGEAAQEPPGSKDDE